MDREAYASPFLRQITSFPKGLFLSLQIDGTTVRGKLAKFPTKIKHQMVIYTCLYNI